MNQGLGKKLAAVAVFAGILSAAGLARTQDVKETWKKVRANWNFYERDDFNAVILFYSRRTPKFIETRKICDAEKKAGPDWRFRIVDLTYMSPGKFFMVYKLSLKEQGLAGKVLMSPGVRIVYGVRDTSLLYVKLPMTGNAYSDKFAEGNVYTSEADSNFCDMRKVFYTRYMKPKFLDDLDHYFKDGTVTIEKKNVYAIKDYGVPDQQKGLLQTHAGAKPQRGVLAFIMVPRNPGANFGVTREEIYVDPATMNPIGFVQFEADGIVSFMLFENLKFNIDITDKTFEYFFSNAKISSKKDSDRIACPCLYY